MDKYTIDFTDCKYLYDIEKAIKNGLRLPDYYGENWDAFWDCIKDFGRERFCIEIVGLDKIKKEYVNYFDMNLKLLFEYREKYNPNLIIKIIYIDDEFYL